MDPTLVFLRAEVSLVILKALFDAILAGEGRVVVSDDQCLHCALGYQGYLRVE